MANRNYYWKAVDQEGHIIDGNWELNDSSEVRKRLFSLGYFPLKIIPQRELFKLLTNIEKINNVTNSLKRLKTWSLLTKYLAILLQSGIPLVKAIEILDQRGKDDKAYRFDWLGVKKKVEAGAEFHQALMNMTPPPPSVVIAIIRAGEYAGRLPETLSAISDDLEKEYIFRRNLSAAYSYPIFLFIFTVLIIYILSAMVLPTFEQIFANLETELPFMTVAVFQITRYCHILVLILIGIVFSIFLVLRFTNPKGYRDVLFDWICHVPLLGNIYQLNMWYQFTNTFAILLDAGIPLLEAIDLTRESVRGYKMKKLQTQLKFAAHEGKTLSNVFRLNQNFPQYAVQMLAIGEESGQMSEMLRFITQTFRFELEEKMQRLPNILGPLLVITISLIIGGVAIGVLLPIFDVGTLLD